ncbi:MAG TPA: hypothetical protein VIK33_12860 [Anaerolineae bacterium]
MKTVKAAVALPSHRSATVARTVSGGVKLKRKTTLLKKGLSHREERKERKEYLENFAPFASFAVKSGFLQWGRET